MISGDGPGAGRIPFDSVSAATIPPAKGKILQVAAELAFGVPQEAAQSSCGGSATSSVPAARVSPSVCGFQSQRKCSSVSLGWGGGCDWSGCCKPCREPCAGFFGVIVEWAEAAAIHDFSGLINDVEALGPRGVGVVRDVKHVIHGEWQRKMESLDEIIGDGDPLRESMRLRIADALIHVGFHLPFVERMSFADVDGEEIGAVLVIVVQGYEVAYLAAEGRSGIAAENEDQRTLADAIA